MSTATKKEVKGTPGVNASQTKTNGSTMNGAVAPKAEPKAEVGQKEPAKSSPIEERMKFYDGLARLVNFKRRFETHKEALLELSMPDEELNKFENEKTYGIRIVLHDADNETYAITNPKLVKDVQAYLVTLLDGKIAEYNQKIMQYGNN